jgi:hypothetical protein
MAAPPAATAAWSVISRVVVSCVLTAAAMVAW